MQRLITVIIILLVHVATAATTIVELKTPTQRAKFDRGRLDLLQSADGMTCVRGGGWSSALNVGGKWQGADQYDLHGQTLSGKFTQGNRQGAELKTEWKTDPANGDIVLRQQAVTPRGGLEAVRWSVGAVPLDWTVIVPNGGGMKFDKNSPQNRFTADGPMFWEVPLIIFQNPKGGGFYVCSEDREWPFYSLEVRRTDNGFESEIITWNFKPFSDKKSCTSMTWRINTFKGDWRVPAKRMRTFFENQLGAKAAFEKNPSWVKEINCILFDEHNNPERIQWLLDNRVVEPQHTMVYLSNWRQQEFDRDYPDYSRFKPKAETFIRFLKSKGFRVMLHTNWFGCDPQNPFYPQVEYAMVKRPDGSKMKYCNPRKKPAIEIDYVNPVAPEWRQEFIRQVKKLVEKTGVDGIHLDQNQHCHNYSGGVIGGKSMIDGSLAIHRELREALPGTAFSGEGLNGLTARYLAFAQRTIWSLVPRQIDPDDLKKYHPVSSYIFSPTTTLYGWLGCGDPAQMDGQLYAAWRDGLARLGTIPTFRVLFLTNPGQVARPTGFRRTEFDEIRFWQQQSLKPALEGPWPADVLFPFESADGKIRAERMVDGAFRTPDRLISATFFGQTEWHGPERVGGAFYYDDRGVYGLNPLLWYPYFSEPRDLRRFHVEKIPADLTVADVRETTDGIDFAIVPNGKGLLDLATELPRAIKLNRNGNGMETARNTTFDDLTDGMIRNSGNLLLMRPPAVIIDRKINGVQQYRGNGTVVVRYGYKIPAEGQSRFAADVCITGNALGFGWSDGVEFEVKAIDPAGKVLSEKLNFDARGMDMAQNKPRGLFLDLTPFAGREITLELSVGPGPNDNATRDEAVWQSPRLERFFKGDGKVRFVAPFQPRSVKAGEQIAVPVSCGGNTWEFVAPLPTRIKITR